jgi:hypothetical protein
LHSCGKYSLNHDGLAQGQTEWTGAIIGSDQINIGYVKSNGFHFDGEIAEIEILGQSIPN